MLARKLVIRDRLGAEICRTPLLLPSFSSKANIDLNSLFDVVSDFIYGPILVSAYDADSFDWSRLLFPTAVFLDSGGYECCKDFDIANVCAYKTEPKQWTEEIHSQQIVQIPGSPSMVVTSYDHPSVRRPLSVQLDKATRLFDQKPDCLHEMLVKPSNGEAMLEMNEISEHITRFEEFDLVGFTEKELGISVTERMMNIAAIRNELDNNAIEAPIHIFGSLDPVTSPLYFLSGADIFDGLTWLRYLFADDATKFIESEGPKLYGPSMPTDEIWSRCLRHNIEYLGGLEKRLSDFIRTPDYSLLPNPHFMESTYNKVLGGIS